MKKQALIYKAIQLVFSFVAFILAGYVFFTSNSLGWFSHNKSGTINGASTTVDYDDMAVDFNIYRCLAGENSATDRDENGNIFSLSDFEFLQYDMIFKERNEYAGVLMYMRITGYKLPKSGSMNIKIDRADSLPVVDEDGEITGYESRETLDSLNSLNGYFSSVMRFYFNIDPTLYGDVATMYDNAKGVYTDWENDCFTTREITTNDGEEEILYYHSDTITINIEYDEDDFRDDGLDLYMFMMYDADLSDDYSGAIKNFGLNIESETDQLLLNDLATIRLKHS